MYFFIIFKYFYYISFLLYLNTIFHAIQQQRYATTYITPSIVAIDPNSLSQRGTSRESQIATLVRSKNQHLVNFLDKLGTSLRL